MPRFFFHVHDGVSERDDIGTALPDLKAARTEAIALAGQVIADDARRWELGEDWTMAVADEHGTVLFRLDFHVSEALPRIEPDEG